MDGFHWHWDICLKQYDLKRDSHSKQQLGNALFWNWKVWLLWVHFRFDRSRLLWMKLALIFKLLRFSWNCFFIKIASCYSSADWLGSVVDEVLLAPVGHSAASRSNSSAGGPHSAGQTIHFHPALFVQLNPTVLAKAKSFTFQLWGSELGRKYSLSFRC